MNKTLSGKIKCAVLFGAVACLAGLAYSAASLGSKPADTSRVIAVYPSGEAVHENLLRISVRFDLPVNQTKPPQIALRGAGGSEIEGAFDRQMLWSADGTLLTLLLGPGRVKTGLDAHEKLGRALTKGETISLFVDGKPVKNWRVIEESNEKINPQSWTIKTPPESRRQPLEIALDAPIDAMNASYIAIVAQNGERVDGHASLDAGETKWRFVPADVWTSGDYQIVVNPHLEDACGNSIISEFETSEDDLPKKPLVVRLNFRID